MIYLKLVLYKSFCCQLLRATADDYCRAFDDVTGVQRYCNTTRPSTPPIAFIGSNCVEPRGTHAPTMYHGATV